MKAFNANILYGIILAVLIGGGVIIDRGTAQAAPPGWCRIAANGCTPSNGCVDTGQAQNCPNPGRQWRAYIQTTIFFSKCGDVPTPKPCDFNNAQSVAACTVDGYEGKLSNGQCYGYVCTGVTNDVKCL